MGGARWLLCATAVVVFENGEHARRAASQANLLDHGRLVWAWQSVRTCMPLVTLVRCKQNNLRIARTCACPQGACARHGEV